MRMQHQPCRQHERGTHGQSPASSGVDPQEPDHWESHAQVGVQAEAERVGHITGA